MSQSAMMDYLTTDNQTEVGLLKAQLEHMMRRTSGYELSVTSFTISSTGCSDCSSSFEAATIFRKRSAKFSAPTIARSMLQPT
jgi:hypothetical protein